MYEQLVLCKRFFYDQFLVSHIGFEVCERDVFDISQSLGCRTDDVRAYSVEFLYGECHFILIAKSPCIYFRFDTHQLFILRSMYTRPYEF